MTTQQEWLFRSEHLKIEAEHKRARAKALILEAEHLEHLASSALFIANKPVRDALDQLDAAIAAQGEPDVVQVS